MKKILSLMVIIMTMVFTGLQSANAQKTVYVSWDPDECDECTVSGGFWRVAVEVYDYCDGPATQVYVQVQYLDLSKENTTFQLTHFCDSQSQEECYFLVASLEKYCPNGHGGYTLSCSGKYPGAYYSCPYLMSSGSPIPCEIEFQP
jgi:hypothetical protein